MSKLNITSVKVTKFESGKLVGFASVEFAKFLVVNGFKIMRKDSGELWIANPSKKDGTEYRDVAYIKDSDARAELTEAILKEFGNTDSKQKPKAKKSNENFENEEEDVNGFASLEGDEDIPF